MSTLNDTDLIKARLREAKDVNPEINNKFSLGSHPLRSLAHLTSEERKYLSTPIEDHDESPITIFIKKAISDE